MNMKMFVGDKCERRKKSRKGNWTTPEGAVQDGVTRDSRPGRENKALEKGSSELILDARAKRSLFRPT